MQVRLLPERIPAVDLGNRPHAPGLSGHFLQPFERAGVPGVSRREWSACPFGRTTSQTTTAMPAASTKAPTVEIEVQGVEANAGRIRKDPARHAEESRRVHRHERDVEADEHQPEREASEPLGQHLSVDQRVVVVEPGQQRKNRAADEHRVQMGDDEEGVVGLKVEGRDGHHDAGQAADDERGEAAEDVEHRHATGPHGRPAASPESRRTGHRSEWPPRSTRPRRAPA